MRRTARYFLAGWSEPALPWQAVCSPIWFRCGRAISPTGGQEAADEQTQRDYTAVAFIELFALNHAISWITWFAKHAPHAVNQQMRASFDAESHGTFPKLLAAMAMVALVNLDMYSELRRLQKRVFDLWEEVAKALHQEADLEVATRTLCDCLPVVEELDRVLPDQLGRMMKAAGAAPRR